MRVARSFFKTRSQELGPGAVVDPAPDLTLPDDAPLDSSFGVFVPTNQHFLYHACDVAKRATRPMSFNPCCLCFRLQETSSGTCGRF
jgi:hypothetical protein